MAGRRLWTTDWSARNDVHGRSFPATGTRTTTIWTADACECRWSESCITRTIWRLPSRPLRVSVSTTHLIKWRICGICVVAECRRLGFAPAVGTCRGASVSKGMGDTVSAEISLLTTATRQSTRSENPKFEIQNSKSNLPCRLSQGCYSYQLRWDGGWLA